MEEDYKKKLSHSIERIGVEDTPLSLMRFNYVYNFTSQHILEDTSITHLMGKDIYEVKEIIVEHLTHEFKCALNSVVFGDPSGKAYFDALKLEHLEKFGIDKSYGKWEDEGTDLVDDIAFSYYIKEKMKGQGAFGLVFAYNQKDFIERKDSEVIHFYQYANTLLRKEKINKIKNDRL